MVCLYQLEQGPKKFCQNAESSDGCAIAMSLGCVVVALVVVRVLYTSSVTFRKSAAMTMQKCIATSRISSFKYRTPNIRRRKYRAFLKKQAFAG